ncbi:MAG TPA: heparinase II/III-family protein, partial [Pyrinomonadaceae bacterium]|nr:heparinase II/III-family protein [Pyrinomonadaceae bacterium]
LCNDAAFKIGDECSPEVFWLLGRGGVERFDSMASSARVSVSFPDAGSHVLRFDDLYALLNTNDVGLNGRGSHSHNDALSIEVSALGRPWIVDPGSYVYNYDREARHRFRSTAAHSTLMIEGREQNTINVDEPFVSSNSARPRLIEWSVDSISAEHAGYAPVVHRRTVCLHRSDRRFSLTDEVQGTGFHELSFAFHIAAGTDIDVSNSGALVRSREHGSLAILCDSPAEATVDEAGFSNHYGALAPTKVIRFVVKAALPAAVHWLIVPLSAGEDPRPRLAALRKLLQNNA